MVSADLKSGPLPLAKPRTGAPRGRTGVTPIPPLHRYHHMHLVLRKRILEGAYPRESLLTSERELAVEFGVARVTVRSALAALERDGLVRREQGRGTIVTGHSPQPDARISEELDAFDVLFDSILSVGLRSTARVLEMRTAELPADVAVMLGLEAGSPVCRLVRLRLLDRRPISYSTVWLPTELARGLTRRELAARPLLSALQREGARVERAEETVSACAADLDVAAALELPIGSPLLSIRRLMLDRHGSPLLVFDGRFRPDRYHYRLQLSREPRVARIHVVTESR